jgi:uncharacterized protein DUF6378
MIDGTRPGQSEMIEADGLVNGDRQADYGTPRANYEGIAKVWSGILWPILKRDITASEAALMMAGLKLQRQGMKHKRDNLVDAHGYLLVYAHIEADSTPGASITGDESLDGIDTRRATTRFYTCSRCHCDFQVTDTDHKPRRCTRLLCDGMQELKL